LLSPRTAVLVIAALLAAGNLAETFRRTTIPLAIEGAVTDEKMFFEKQRGVDDIHLVTIGDRTLHVTKPVAELMEIGDRVQKQAWSRSISVNGERSRLSPSQDFLGMLIVMPVVLAVVILLNASTGSGARDQRRRGRAPSVGRAPPTYPPS
jgi:hypothetical protein